LTMRPIAYGLIAFFGAGTLWFLFSVLAGFQVALAGSSSYMPLVYVFGVIFFFSLPAAIVAEVIRWRRRRTR